jgi:hypothetical protein
VAYYRATSFKRVIFIGTMHFGLYASPSRLEMPPENWAFIAYENALEPVMQQKWLMTLRSAWKPGNILR